MSTWFHTALGKYDISNRWVGLDYAKLFLDPIQADITLAHESIHGVLAMKEFGQASQVIIKLLDEFIHLNDGQKQDVGKILIQEQKFVQEGFATFMEVSTLRRLTDKTNALRWAKDLPQDYKDRFERLKFAFDLAQGYRDFFTSKISDLAMETGIRRIMPKLNLLKNNATLRDYICQEDNSPNRRLEKVIETLRYKTWLVTKSPPDIASACGISYHDPSTKEEVADFLNYVTSFTNNPKTFLPSDIGDTPLGANAFIEVMQNMIVANMNINLAETAETLFNLKDFLFYSDTMELIFVNPNTVDKHTPVIKKISGTDPDINIGGFLKSGEKYLTSTSKEKAIEILSKDLKTATMMVKWDRYEPLYKSLIWSPQARLPDLVVYNYPQEMLLMVRTVLKAKPKTRFLHLHLKAAEDHPIRTLLVKLEGESPIHALNTYGNKGVIEILKELEGHSRTLSPEEIKADKVHLNNLMSFWMGLNWKIDWIETMLDGKELHFKK